MGIEVATFLSNHLTPYDYDNKRLRDARPAVRKGEESSQGSAARDAITPIVANMDIPMNSFADRNLGLK